MLSNMPNHLFQIIWGPMSCKHVKINLISFFLKSIDNLAHYGIIKSCLIIVTLLVGVGHSEYILVGVCPGTYRGGGVLGAGTARKGGLRCGHKPQKRGILGTCTVRKSGLLGTCLVLRDGIRNSSCTIVGYWELIYHLSLRLLDLQTKK